MDGNTRRFQAEVPDNRGGFVWLIVGSRNCRQEEEDQVQDSGLGPGRARGSEIPQTSRSWSSVGRSDWLAPVIETRSRSRARSRPLIRNFVLHRR